MKRFALVILVVLAGCATVLQPAAAQTPAASDDASFTPALAVDQLALQVVDGNGFTLTSAEAYYQFQNGQPMIELPDAVLADLLSLGIVDTFIAQMELGRADMYYPVVVQTRVVTFADAETSATYASTLFDTIAVEHAAAPDQFRGLQRIGNLPDHHQTIDGWKFETLLSDGGALPTVRVVAQIGTTAISVTVVSQDPGLADFAARSLLDNQLTCMAVDAPCMPVPFPIDSLGG